MIEYCMQFSILRFNQICIDPDPASVRVATVNYPLCALLPSPDLPLPFPACAQTLDQKDSVSPSLTARMDASFPSPADRQRYAHGLMNATLAVASRNMAELSATCTSDPLFAESPDAATAVARATAKYGARVTDTLTHELRVFEQQAMAHVFEGPAVPPPAAPLSLRSRRSSIAASASSCFSPSSSSASAAVAGSGSVAPAMLRRELAALDDESSSLDAELIRLRAEAAVTTAWTDRLTAATAALSAATAAAQAWAKQPETSDVFGPALAALVANASPATALPTVTALPAPPLAAPATAAAAGLGALQQALGALQAAALHHPSVDAESAAAVDAMLSAAALPPSGGVAIVKPALVLSRPITMNAANASNNASVNAAGHASLATASGASAGANANAGNGSFDGALLRGAAAGAGRSNAVSRAGTGHASGGNLGLGLSQGQNSGTGGFGAFNLSQSQSHMSDGGSSVTMITGAGAGIGLGSSLWPGVHP